MWDHNLWNALCMNLNSKFTSRRNNLWNDLYKRVLKLGKGTEPSRFSNLDSKFTFWSLKRFVYSEKEYKVWDLGVSFGRCSRVRLNSELMCNNYEMFCTTKGLENRIYSSGFYRRYTWVFFPFLNQWINVHAKDAKGKVTEFCAPFQKFSTLFIILLFVIKHQIFF